MKVFISWSGPQSNYIAQALRDWLRNVIQNLNPWMSEVDINAGDRWGERLWKELQDSQFGVVCLTAENLQAPWLHYEAGALAKAVDRRVCPYLYEIKPTMVQGPLSHHQAKQVDKQGTKELLHSINTASLTLTKIGLSSEQLDKTFNTWWPQLEEKLSAVPPSTTAPPPRRETADMVEELLEIGRRLERAADTTINRRIRAIDKSHGKVERELDKMYEILKKAAKLPQLDPDIGASIDKKLDDLEKAFRERISLYEESISTSDTPQNKKLPSK